MKIFKEKSKEFNELYAIMNELLNNDEVEPSFNITFSTTGARHIDQEKYCISKVHKNRLSLYEFGDKSLFITDYCYNMNIGNRYVYMKYKGGFYFYQEGKSNGWGNWEPAAFNKITDSNKLLIESLKNKINRGRALKASKKALIKLGEYLGDRDCFLEFKK